ncbi:MAG: hypothetical protein LBQ66_11785 [Planctomycetaceae bacterium]|jgi:hypothetical protein|nr:hypothetical protein [Planctomycetaceae bacterium]
MICRGARHCVSTSIHRINALPQRPERAKYHSIGQRPRSSPRRFAANLLWYNKAGHPRFCPFTLRGKLVRHNEASRLRSCRLVYQRENIK